MDKDSLYKILLTIILGGLGLVLFSHMPLLSNYRKIFIAILILNGILVALKIVYPLMFRKAIWGLSEWGAVLLIILSFQTICLLVSYQYIIEIDSISIYVHVFFIQLLPILLIGIISAIMAWKRTNKFKRFDFKNGVLNFKRTSKRSKIENAIILFITVYSLLVFPFFISEQLEKIDFRFVILGIVSCLIIPFLSSMLIDIVHQIIRIFVWQHKNNRCMYIKSL